MGIKRRPLVARDLVTLEAFAPSYEYEPDLQLSVDSEGRPVIGMATVQTHTITKQQGDPPEAPDVAAAAATHTFTRQQGDPPEAPDVWDLPRPGRESGDTAADDLSTGVVTF